MDLTAHLVPEFTKWKKILKKRNLWNIHFYNVVPGVDFFNSCFSGDFSKTDGKSNVESSGGWGNLLKSVFI